MAQWTISLAVHLYIDALEVNALNCRRPGVIGVPRFRGDVSRNCVGRLGYVLSRRVPCMSRSHESVGQVCE